MRAARRLFPFVEVIFADGAYRGEATAKAVAGTGRWRLEIVSRGDAEGFVPLAKRWIVIACTELPNRGSSGPRRSSEGGCARWAMTRGMSLAEAADYFGVSEKLMAFRFGMSGADKIRS